jgi:hypothetical protein
MFPSYLNREKNYSHENYYILTIIFPSQSQRAFSSASKQEILQIKIEDQNVLGCVDLSFSFFSIPSVFLWQCRKEVYSRRKVLYKTFDSALRFTL